MINTLLEYLLNTRPLGFAIWGSFFFVSAIIAIILAIVAKIFIKKIPVFYGAVAKKTINLLIYYGAISLFFYFLRLQRIPYLSMRIWLWLWILGICAGAIFMIYKELKKVPIKQERFIKKMKQKRYFED
jgi:Ca2+/Na+ antiporter